MTARQRASVVAAVAAVLLWATACGIPAEDSAREITRTLPPTAASSPGPTPVPQGTVSPAVVSVKFYFIKADKLVPAERRLPAFPTVKDLLRDLVSGPTQAEFDGGLRSALLGSEVIVDVTVDSAGVAVVQLAPETVLGTSEQSYAWGQVVCTLVSHPFVTAVSFIQNGEPTAVLDGSGQLAQGPLTASSYALLVGES